MKRFIIAICITVLSGNSFAQTIPLHRIQAVDRYLQSIIEQEPVPGFAVAVVSADQILLSRGYGVVKNGEQQSVTEYTSFAIGSLTKSFTALAVMQLVEQDLLDLDFPVIRYLPWFRTADKERSDRITLRMLLSSTSGIPSMDRDIFSRNVSDDADERLVRSLSSTVLETDPGSSFEYANEGFVVAGLIIEAVSGLQYREYLQKNIFEPLGINDSSTDPEKLKQMKLSSGHFIGRDTGMPVTIRGMAADYMASGSLLHCSAADLTHYLIMLLNQGTWEGKQIISKESTEELWQVVTELTGLSVEDGGEGLPRHYALGWFIEEIEERNWVHHGGNIGIMSSFTMLDPIEGLAVSIIANIDSLDFYNYTPLFNITVNVLHILRGEVTTSYGIPRKEDPTRESYHLPGSLYERYIGNYQSVDSTGVGKVIVYRDQEELLLDFYIAGIPICQTRLDFANEVTAHGRSIGPPLPIRFQIRPDGRVTALTIATYDMKFYREKDGGFKEYITTTDFKTSLPEGWILQQKEILYNKENILSSFSALREDAKDYSFTVLALSEKPAAGGEPTWEKMENFLDGEIITRGIVANETFGFHSWFERAYELQTGENRWQAMLCVMEFDNRTFVIILTTPYGFLTKEAATTLQQVMANFSIVE